MNQDFLGIPNCLRALRSASIAIKISSDVLQFVKSKIYLVSFFIISLNLNLYIKRIDNTSGVTGVCFDKRINKWYAQIKVKNKKRITLGYFTNFEEAVVARKEAEQKYFGEYSYDNSLIIGGY